MHQFGVLVERIGFEPHGNSAPLAQLKSKPQNTGVPPMPNFVDVDLDDIFYTQKNTTGTGSTPTYDRRTGVKVSQPSSSPADDLFPLLEPPADASCPFTESDWLYVQAQNLIDVELERLRRATKFKKEETVKKSNMFGIFGMGTPTTSISKPIPQKKEPVSGGSFPAGQKPPAYASCPFTESDWLQPNTVNVQDQNLVDFELEVQNLADFELERLGKVTKFKKEETVKKSNLDGIFGMCTPTTSISKPIPQKKEPVSGGSFPGGQKPPADASCPFTESEWLSQIQ